VARGVPVGFGEIRLRFDLDADLSADERERLLALTERYCVVYQTLRSAVPMSSALGS